jgi:transcriptional regulator with XRE-family HTH domain
MTIANENIYPIQVARAAMALKGLSVRDIAERTDVQKVNIEAYLRGFTSAISIESADMIFRNLGIDSTGLSRTRVHFFNIKLGRFNTSRSLMPLKTLMPLIGSHGAMTLGKVNGITPVLIKSDAGHRIVLLVKSKAFHKVTPQELGLTPGSFEGNQSVATIPDYYYELMFANNLKPNYFDLILTGDFRTESIDLLRIVALEYDITLSEIIANVTKVAEQQKAEIEPEIFEEKMRTNIFSFVDRKASA